MKISIGGLWLALGLGSATIVQAQVIGSAGGTGPLPAVAERVATLPQHTLYRPLQFPTAPLPLLVWGNGACRGNGLAYETLLYRCSMRDSVWAATAPE